MAENACLIGEGFEGACQEPPAYAVRWADNGDEGLLCEAHAAVARAMQNGHTMTLRSLSPESAKRSSSESSSTGGSLEDSSK